MQKHILRKKRYNKKNAVKKILQEFTKYTSLYVIMTENLMCYFLTFHIFIVVN